MFIGPCLRCCFFIRIRTNPFQLLPADTRAANAFTRREPRMRASPYHGRRGEETSPPPHHLSQQLAGLVRARHSPFQHAFLSRRALPKICTYGWTIHRVRERIFCACNRQILRNSRFYPSDGIVRCGRGTPRPMLTPPSRSTAQGRCIAGRA
jgi:hypothetical protein